jgi:hypothetical protein
VKYRKGFADYFKEYDENEENKLKFISTTLNQFYQKE